MIETAAEHGGLAAVASEGAGIRSVREFAAMPAPLGDKLLAAAVQGGVDRGVRRLLRPDAAAEPASISWTTWRPRRCCSCTRRPARAARSSSTPSSTVAHPARQLWAIDGAGHAAGSREQPAAYERRIVDFFDAALLR